MPMLSDQVQQRSIDETNSEPKDCMRPDGAMTPTMAECELANELKIC